MFAIEARGLTKSFRGVTAVDDLDVLVEEGEVVALLGPNGAGKTTTLMMLMGIAAPDAGSVSLLGRRLPKERSSVLAQVNFAASYVSLPHDLRVKHHLWVFADLYGVPRSRAIETLELFRIGHLFDRLTTHLSSGQRTLVGLAKAMLNRPRLLCSTSPRRRSIPRSARTSAAPCWTSRPAPDPRSS